MSTVILAAIERIILEHKRIMQNLNDIEHIANDAEAMSTIDKAKSDFMPGKLNHKNGILELQEMYEKLNSGIRAHFNFEETELTRALEQTKHPEAVEALHMLLLEHNDLRDRFAQAQNEIARLARGDLDKNLWQAAGYDMRAHLTYTHKMLLVHAGKEQEMLLALKHKLEAEGSR